MKITLEMLRGFGACNEGVSWFKNQKRRTVRSVIPALVKDGHASWANWLLVRLMTQPQKIQYAVFAAELSLPLFEKRFPEDKRPRAAIEAAKDLLTGKITADAAAYAAANAAYAAYAAYAADAAYAANAANAAAYAAYAAANAAYAVNAANAAAYAAYAAANAANAAYAANAAANAAYAADAAYAAYAAANAANAADAAYAAYAAARRQIEIKTTNYGLQLLGLGGKTNGK